MVSASVNGDRLVVHFDEDLAAAPDLDNGAFTVHKTPEDGTEETAALSGAPVIAGATVTLTLDTAVVSTDGDVKVSYAKPASGSGNFLRDASGNAVADFTGQSVSNNTPAPGEAAAVSVWYVYFDQPTYTARRAGRARVTVHLNAPWKPERNEALTVYLSTIEHKGGASEGDYSGIPASVTFQPGQTAVPFTVRATNDNADDDGESITFGIGHRSYYDDRSGISTYGVAIDSGDPEDYEDVDSGRGPHTVTVRLEDNTGPKPVTVSFGAVAYKAVEGGDVALVEVRLSEAPGRRVLVPLTAAPAEGAGPGDYAFGEISLSPTVGDLLFLENDTSAIIDVVAVDDSDDDDGESVTLGFGELPAGVSAGSPAETEVYIEDNDGGQPALPQLTLRFGSADTRVAEVREGISFSLAATLDEAPEADVHIPLLVEYTGGATAADVRGLPATLTIEAGQRRANVILRMVDDADTDPGEGFKVTFGALPPGVAADARYDEAIFLMLTTTAIRR